MVASGLGAGLVREDQAREAQRLGEAVVWSQGKTTTWLCWIAAPAARQSLAVRTLGESSGRCGSRGAGVCKVGTRRLGQPAVERGERRLQEACKPQVGCVVSGDAKA